MNQQLWLIGGTGDSAAISRLLSEREIPFVVSVVTPSARCLYDDRTNIAVGRMDKAQMRSFCLQKKIGKIIDASHPYAVEVSQNAIAVSQKLNIAYLRYERSSDRQDNSSINNSLITKLDNFEALITGDYLVKQRVLLTIGCKTLPLFKTWHDRSTLYARILPKIESLKIAQQAGFTSDRLIAMRPPFNADLERVLWQQWQISLVVTKASGKAGGENIKRQIAEELNIPLVIIDRPKIAYPQQTFSLSEIINFVTLSQSL